MPLTETEAKMMIACEKEKQEIAKLQALAYDAKASAIIAKLEATTLVFKAKRRCAELKIECEKRKRAEAEARKLELQLEIMKFQAQSSCNHT